MEVLSDRSASPGVERPMKAGGSRSLLLSLVLGTCLCACSGELSNPDLTTGAVAGRVANAAAAGGGYVYVLGASAITAPIAADGSYQLSGVPVGAQQLVVVAPYEGGGVSVVKAVRAPVAVRPGMRERLSQDAAAMPAAGRVVAAVRPPPGAAAQGATFSVLLSNQRDVGGSAGGKVLGDLPAGTWQVTARLPGYRDPPPVAAAVPEGAGVQVEIDLEVEEESAQRGCLATGCDNGLHCSSGDGRCYPCVDLSHCNGDDLACDPVSHTCVEGTDGAGDLCEAADSAQKCPGGIWVQTQASPPLGYCSRACPGSADAECPAGWRCGGGVCQVLVSCAATRSAYGSPCSRSSTCQGALAAGRCVREDDDHPGTCSAPCLSDQSCQDAGLGIEWTCRPLPGAQAGSQGYCRRGSD